ncbi:hypothetical protein OG555_16475 [Kribbella sp. NBC_01484]|uniref:hypothetical protein n=1 Tax=Kribbella sp. NBC_01484 TaxID=2903579 RepID=UPI002E332E52|nr:hypothetical protein [Kribbella sp. NBC_01484]
MARRKAVGELPTPIWWLEMLHALVRLVAALEHLNIRDIRLPDELTVVRDEVARCRLVVAKCVQHGINCLLAPGGEALESHSRVQGVFLVGSAPARNKQAQFAEQIKFGNRLVCAELEFGAKIQQSVASDQLWPLQQRSINGEGALRQT